MDTVTQQLKEMQRTRNRPAAVEPFVLDESLYPIEQENQLIDYFRTVYTEKRKKMMKIIHDTYHRVPRFMQKSIMDQLVNSVDPCHTLTLYFEEKRRWMEVIDQLISEGNHGVIYNDQEVYGFSLEKTGKDWLKEENKWNIDDEKDIIKRAYYKHCRERKLNHFRGKVMMFHHFGFSGMSYFFDHRISDDDGY